MYKSPWKVGQPWKILGALSNIFKVVQPDTSHCSQQMAREQSTMQSTNHRVVVIDMNTDYLKARLHGSISLINAIESVTLN
jgi:hypothetical protein